MKDTWHRHVTPKTRSGVCRACQSEWKEGRAGLRAGIRATTGAGQNKESRSGIGKRKEQVQRDRGLLAGTRTTTNAAARIIDTGERASAHKIQVWHDRQGQHKEHEEKQGQEAGGQVSAGSEEKKKASATSGVSKDNAFDL